MAAAVPLSGTTGTEMTTRRYADLGAAVCVDGAPCDLAREIPALGEHLLSTLDFFVVYEQKQPDGCCVLDEPRRVLLLRREGAELHILNRMLELSPPVLERVCAAVFRAYPDVRRLCLELLSPASQLPLPWTPVRKVTFMVIDLPTSADDYYASLGKSTRKTIRGYRNRLERDFPDLVTETVRADGRSRRLVERLAAWKVRRFREQGRSAYWETDAELVERTAAFLECGGWCRVTSVAGAEAAIQLCFRVGDSVYGFESAHDPAYDAYRLGFLSMYDTVVDAIESGARRFDALTGSVGPKELLGARRVVTSQVTVHRSRLRRELWLAGGKVSRNPGGATLLRAVDAVRSRRPPLRRAG